MDDGVSYHLIPNGALASMNLWAFSEGFIDDIEVSFEKRFVEGVKKDLIHLRRLYLMQFRVFLKETRDS